MGVLQHKRLVEAVLADLPVVEKPRYADENLLVEQGIVKQLEQFEYEHLIVGLLLLDEVIGVFVEGAQVVDGLRLRNQQSGEMLNEFLKLLGSVYLAQNAGERTLEMALLRFDFLAVVVHPSHSDA